MKPVFTFSLLLFLTTALHAQPTGGVQVYAYTQTVSAGAKAKSAPDDGIGIENRKARTNTWIYVTVPSNAKFRLKEFYLNGKKYNAKLDTLPSDQVLFINSSIPNQPDTTVLVPKTEGVIYLITPAGERAFTPTKSKKSAIENNDLLLYYKVGCKKYRIALKEMARLQRAVLP